MIRGLHTAASGMFSLERKQEALANNLANAQTPGYKKDDAVLRAFPKLVLHRMNDFNEAGKVVLNGTVLNPGALPPIGELYNGVYTQELIPSFTQGSFVETSNPLDIAINDQGLPRQEIDGRQVKQTAFFAVQLADGEIGYTRNGKWDVDANGNLVTSEGYAVLGANNQPIGIPIGISKDDLTITDNGQLLAFANDPVRMRNIGQLGIAISTNPMELKRIGGNVYQAETPLPIVQGDTANQGISLQQGFIEQSNVDPGQTMTEMMVTLKGYEANQKVISAYDRSLEQLYSVGKING
ncbi:flagellar hook-basal body protein [Pseudoneobacillus sp. C159]